MHADGACFLGGDPAEGLRIFWLAGRAEGHGMRKHGGAVQTHTDAPLKIGGHEQRKLGILLQAIKQVGGFKRLIEPLRVPCRQGLHLQDLPGGRQTDLPLLGQGRQITVQLHSEGQKIVPLFLQQGPYRPDPIRTGRLAGRNSATTKSNRSRRMAYSGPATERMSSRSQRANNATSSANAIALASAGRAYDSFLARLWSLRP